MPTLLTDLDRTLTGPDLQLDARALGALKALRRAGVRVILATGRPLDHVLRLGLREATDGIVAENGAILVVSGTRESVIHGAAFPDEAREALGDLADRFAWSRAMGSGPREVAEAARGRLAAAGVEHHAEYNAEEVMLLPPGVDKASGARALLRLLGARPRRVWAIGDGENDLALFRIADESAAPAHADERVRRSASLRLAGRYAEGFLEFARRMSSP